MGVHACMVYVSMCVFACMDVDLHVCNAEIQKVGNEDALKKQRLLRIVEMLGFVLSSTADQAQLNLQPQARNYSGMRFLCDLFSCCKCV